MRISHLVLATLYFAATLMEGGSNSKNSKSQIQFFGRVDTADLIHKMATVRHGRIPGYADRGVDEYSVAGEEVLEKLRPGDDIKATVHPDERVLYNVVIVFRDHKGP